MPSIKETIASLDALREKTEPQEWVSDHFDDENVYFGTNEEDVGACFDDESQGTDNAEYIIALHNSYDVLRNAALAGAELVSTCLSVDCPERTGGKCSATHEVNAETVKRAIAGEKIVREVTRFANPVCSCKGADVKCIHVVINDALVAYKEALK